MRRDIDEHRLRDVYRTIDLPLSYVLARMERTGIRIDPAALKPLSVRDGLWTCSDCRRKFVDLAGKPFNINSPQQLGKVLFEDLSLPAPVKYGKGKTISTAADVLETLAAEHEIARKVLDYRQLSKLKGTYVDALPLLIDPAHGPSAHDVQPDRGRYGAAVFVESEPAEYPDSHRAGPRDPRRVRSAGRLEAGGGGLFADRTAAAGAHVARSAAAGRIPQRRRHPHAHGRGGVRRARR